MFKSARLKLTAWYLLITMAVSISFSVVVYKTQINEVERFARAEQLRLERRFRVPFVVFDENVVLEIKRRLIFLLLGIDGIILVAAGGLGYFLAGRTLKPIAEMVDEQNQFITDSSHELRTPLTSLKSAMEVNLRDKKLTLKGARNLIAENIDEVNKLQSLSDGLIQLTQYGKSNGSTVMKNVSLNEIVNKAIDRVKLVAKQKAVTINDNVGEFKVFGNKYGITDLLVILLDNAIKYSPEKSAVEITAQKTDGIIKIFVKDQGIGMAKEEVLHIFDRFYRADTARSKINSGGYGLGLSIAKKIVELHHGTIMVESEIGKGSTFIVNLPIEHNRKPEKNLFSHLSVLVSRLAKA